MGASKKFWDPILISATVEASNFKFGTQVGFGWKRTKKQHLGPKLAGVGATGAFQKLWDPLLISATVEASNSKFGTQLGFGEYVTITALVPNSVGAGWSISAPQKLCRPRNSCRHVIKLQI